MTRRELLASLEPTPWASAVEAADEVQIPMGRESVPPRIGCLRMAVPRFWFHNPMSRGLEPEGPIGVAAYPLPPAEHVLAREFVGADPRAAQWVYLSPTPLGSAEHCVLVDIAAFADRVRLTGQAEGYAVAWTGLPVEAIRWVGSSLRAGRWAALGATSDGARRADAQPPRPRS